MFIPALENFNLGEWIEANRSNWGQRRIRPIWESADFIMLMARGPSQAKDFHINPKDEIFYQIEGDLHLNYVTAEGKREIRVLKPGELFLLPAKVPHSPRRPGETSWTLVIERQRERNDIDLWMWFCETCNCKLYETLPRTGEGPTTRGIAVLDEAKRVLREDEKLRTCTNCGAVLPAPN